MPKELMAIDKQYIPHRTVTDSSQCSHEYVAEYCERQKKSTEEEKKIENRKSYFTL